MKWAILHPFTQCSTAEYDDNESVDYNQQFYGKMIELAIKNNLGIAFENMIEDPQRRKFSARAEELLHLVNSFADERVGACFDFGHGHRMYKDLSLPVYVLGHKLKALHVNDNTGISDLHFIPFMGTVNWEKVLKALKEICYEGDFTYEIYGFTKKMPDMLRDAAASFSYEAGMYCMNFFNQVL